MLLIITYSGLIAKKIMARKKKDERKVIKLVRKSNQLVEARYKFDIWETRVFTKMLTMIDKNDKDFKNYRIYMTDLIKELGLEKSKSSYEMLKQSGHKLMRKIIKVVVNTEEDGLMELTTPIVVGMKNPLDASSQEAKFIDISFHPDMKPMLLSLKSQFTTYDARNILKLPSTYSIRIYELLKQYEKIGTRKFDLEELKQIIGVVEEMDENGKKTLKDSYPLFGNFKQRVLLKAKKDLKKYTDISFEFEPFKRGRKVAGLKFFIYPNNPERKAKGPTIKSSKIDTIANEQDTFLELYAKVSQWIGKEAFQKLFSEYPEAQVRRAITYTLNRLKKGDVIQNVAGHIVAMTKEKNLVDTIEIKKDAIKLKKAKQAENNERKLKLENQKKDLLEKWQKNTDAIIQAIFLEIPDKKAEILEFLQSNKISRYKPELSLEENFQNPFVRVAFRNRVKDEFANRFEALDTRYNKEIKELQEQIDFL